MRYVPFLSILFLFLFLICLFLYDLSFCFFVLIIVSIWQLYCSYEIGYFSILGDLFHRESEKKSYQSVYFGSRVEGESVNWEDVRLYYLLPNYKEDLNVMKDTLKHLSESVEVNVREQVVVVLCMEERESGSRDKAQELKKLFDGVFQEILISVHPKSLPGESACKGSNLKFACRFVEEHVKEASDVDPDHVLLMCTDADMLVSPQFLSCVFCHFCLLPDRHYYCYGGPLIMDLNIDEIPVLTRVISLIANNTQMSFMGKFKSRLSSSFSSFSSSSSGSLDHISQSTFCVSWRSVKECGYWSKKHVAEDYHLFLKLSLHFGGRFRSLVLPFPLCGYSLDSGSYLQTMKDRYGQAKRHALGMFEIVYFLRKSLRSVFDAGRLPLPLLPWLQLLYHLSFHHLILLTQFVTLTGVYSLVILATYLVTLFPGQFPYIQDVFFANTYVKIFGLLQTGYTLPFLAIVYTHTVYFMQKKKNIASTGAKLASFLYLFIRAFLELSMFLPFATILYGVIPTIVEAAKMTRKEQFDFIVAKKNKV